MRRVWLGVLGLLAGAMLACAQSPDLISPVWEPDSVVPGPSEETQEEVPAEAPEATPEADTSNRDFLDKRLLGPEIWRLPPVSPAAAMPMALAMPPIETLPAPKPDKEPAPVANMPIALPESASDVETFDLESAAEESESLWDGSFDLGLDGSEGNSETFNFRFGAHANRKCESNIITLGIDYNKSTASTKPTANRLFFDGRFEWLIRNSRWSWFLHETVEYDEFQSFNVRDTSDIGLGYRLIRSETTTLIGRFGGGFSHEFGGPDDGEFTPEAVFGMQFEHHINKRQKLLGLVEYAPGIADFLDYRIRSQAAWEVLLDSVRNLSLRIGVLNYYVSNPNGARPNDLNYATVVIWKF